MLLKNFYLRTVTRLMYLGNKIQNCDNQLISVLNQMYIIFYKLKISLISYMKSKLKYLKYLYIYVDENFYDECDAKVQQKLLKIYVYLKIIYGRTCDVIKKFMRL